MQSCILQMSEAQLRLLEVYNSLCLYVNKRKELKILSFLNKRNELEILSLFEQKKETKNIAETT